MCEEEASVVEIRPVEKAALALNGPVGGSVSYVLGLNAVVLGDGGVTFGAVVRYVSVGDLDRVSGGGSTDKSGVDSVVLGAFSVCLCDLDSFHQVP